MFPALISISQNIKHISLTFDINDFRIQQDDDGNFEIWSNVYNTCYKSDTLLPALPYIGYNVLVRNTEKYANHLSSSSKELVRNNVNLAHNPVAVPTDMLPAMNVRSNTNPYEQKKYPDIDVEYVGTNDCGDYRLLTFHVCPFEFDATTRSLYLKSRIDFDIRLSANSPASLSGYGLTAAMRDFIKKMVVNPEDMDMTPRTMSNSNDLTLQTGYEYVIVTTEYLKGKFQDLADWKSHKGIRSKVITVEEIDRIYNDSTRQERIKSAIKSYPDRSYVLLGGDTLNVPTCMCYIGFLEDTDSITPADSYYSCLGTMNWDYDQDDLYGELEDSVSLFPCLIVSRAPVSTEDDAQVFVNRIINYESAPDTTYWKNSILMCGTSIGYKDSNNIWHPIYDSSVPRKSDTQVWSERIYNEYIKPLDSNQSKWDGDSTFFYDTYTDMSGDGTYDFTASNLQTELQKGYTFADVMTHGSIVTWHMESGGIPYSYNKARILNNSGYTIITTIACKTNAFDYSTQDRKCLSQELINNTNSGILAYWGTSRSNFIFSNLNELNNGLKYDALTYRRLLEDKYHRMGNATTKVKREMMSLALGSYNLDRKIWMELNLMGDPEMPVYVSKPKAFQNVDIQFVNDSIYVETNSNGFDICLINQADSTEYYIARDIETSNATFGRHNGSFGVCVTKPNFIPKSMVCDINYLQNKTFTGSKLYATKHVMIGSNVTNKVAQGAVVINSGSTTVNASQDVTITKDFEVKTGAEFIIMN